MHPVDVVPKSGDRKKGKGEPQTFLTAAVQKRALVIHPYGRGADKSEGSDKRDPEALLDEACSLAGAIDLYICQAQLVPLTKIRPATLLGVGKIEELAATAKLEAADILIVDASLTAVQQRNLERAVGVKVIDRTGLILEIFGARARTKEGVLQVELAHLTYQQSRLVRSWTHLERQRGGFGFLGGPGETQIEADRRQLRDRIARLRKDLEAVRRTRRLHRKKRKKVPYPVVALVGYTNAGKSTLFNRLTRAEVKAEDMLFATLDPTLRMIETPAGRKVILSDTVGFISNLPTQLVAAFRATLEEVVEADLLLHVRNIAHQDYVAQYDDVNQVLYELMEVPEDGATEATQISEIEVLNKIDLLIDDKSILDQAIKTADRHGKESISLSAVTGQGCDLLLEKIDTFFDQQERYYQVRFPMHDGATYAWLSANGHIEDIQETDNHMFEILVRLSDQNAGRLKMRKDIEYIEINDRS